MKIYTVISILFLLFGCTTDKLVFIERKNESPIDGMVVCLNPELKVYEKEIKAETAKRFTHFVCIVGHNIEGAEWKTLVNNEPSYVQDLQLNVAGLAPRSNVVMWINNPSKHRIKTYPNVFYFTSDVFANYGINTSIWEAQSTP